MRSRYTNSYAMFIRWRRRVEKARRTVRDAEQVARLMDWLAVVWTLVAVAALVWLPRTGWREFTLAILTWFAWKERARWKRRSYVARKTLARREAEPWRDRA